MGKYYACEWESATPKMEFECNLLKNGYRIDTINEWDDHYINYQLTKDGVSLEFKFYRDNALSMDTLMRMVDLTWKIRELVQITSPNTKEESE